MSEDLEKLRAVGVQKIHEKTHIARKFVQDLLDENYSSMNFVQYNGFLSILEKEYKLDLSAMKQKAKSHYNTQKPSLKKEKAIKEVAKSRQKRDMRSFYGFITILLFVFFAIYLADLSKTEEVVKVDNSVIESAKQAVITKAIEQNRSSILEDLNQSMQIGIDENITQQLQEEKIEENITQALTIKEQVVEEVNQTKQPIVSHNMITIKPKEQIWLGYIDLSNYKKSQKLFADKLELDANKEWLLYFGHSFLSIQTSNETKEYNSKSSIKFLYKNSKLKEISNDEFTSLNKGQKW